MLERKLFFTVILTASVIAVSASSSPAQTASQKYHHEVTLKYFTQVSMTCDHPDLNVTTLHDVRSISWMLPDGTMVDASSPADTLVYVFSGPSAQEGSGGATAAALEFSAYNLTVLRVDDEVFGYYTCLIVYGTPGRLPSAVRWGLNVDGADFSDLMDTYKTNAIIGGCAAAAMLLIVGGGCLVWNVRQGKMADREKNEGRFDSDLTVVAEAKSSNGAQDNHAYASDIEVTTSIDNYEEAVRQDIKM